MSTGDETYDEWMNILKGLRHLDCSLSIVSSWEKSIRKTRHIRQPH
jgi:hypothetical protein